MYEDLCDIDKLELYYKKVRLCSKHRRKILNFETYYMINIAQIYNVLLEHKYIHSSYNIFLIKEPKYRIIMSEIISDKIINHLLSEEVLLPILEPKLIPMNVATRKKKGIKLGLYYTKKYINALKMKYDNFYILKCDISKYFYSIDHDILLQKLSSYIKDEDILNMIRNIISTTNNSSTNDQITKLVKQEKKRLIKMNNHDLQQKLNELDKIPLYYSGKGIPIGNMTSQIFAVFFLNDLDHFIKEKLHIKYYIRYMDDFILLHPNKEYLQFCLDKIKIEIEKLNLTLNHKTTIISMHQGFSFMGYRFILKKKRLIILLNSKTKKRITKKLKYVINNKNLSQEKKQNILASYHGYFLNAHCKSYLYRHGWYKDQDK